MDKEMSMPFREKHPVMALIGLFAGIMSVVIVTVVAVISGLNLLPERMFMTGGFLAIAAIGEIARRIAPARGPAQGLLSAGIQIIIAIGAVLWDLTRFDHGVAGVAALLVAFGLWVLVVVRHMRDPGNSRGI